MKEGDKVRIHIDPMLITGSAFDGKEGILMILPNEWVSDMYDKANMCVVIVDEYVPVAVYKHEVEVLE